MSDVDDCLGCLLVAESPVTLWNEKIVCSSCECWRHQCEVQHTLSMETVDERRSYLAGVEKKRGAGPTKILRDAIRERWEFTRGSRITAAAKEEGK